MPRRRRARKNPSRRIWTTRLASIPASPRDAGLDALRALAVVGMMAAHTARLIPFDARPAWARVVLLYEPLIPSLFLLLVGLSLARSFAAAQARDEGAGSWYARQARRAAGLWAISVLFFVAEYGVRLPDALLTGGILTVIACSILCVGAILSAGRAATPLLAAFIAAGSLVFRELDATGQGRYPLTSGSAPFLPLVPFAGAGALWERLRGSAAGARALRVGAFAGAALAAWLIARHGVDALFTKPLGRGDAGRDLAAPLFSEGAALHVGFYNLRPALAVVCLGILFAALGAAGEALRRVPEKTARFAFALGRHALAIYVFHLTLLAALVVIFGRQPLSGTTGTAVLIGILGVCQGWAFFREKSAILR